MSEAPSPTPGVNSYFTLTEAQAIAAGRLYTDAWRAADTDQQSRALITATAVLDTLKWEGMRTADTQTLAWPRRCVRDAQFNWLAIDAIPTAVTIACAELAFHLLTQASHPGAPVQMRMLGDSMVMHFPHMADELPRHVRRLIEPFLIVRSAHGAELIA